MFAPPEIVNVLFSYGGKRWIEAASEMPLGRIGAPAGTCAVTRMLRSRLKELLRPMPRRSACCSLPAVALLALGWGCSSDPSCDRVTIADLPWASAALTAQIQKIIFEDGYGCAPELVPSEAHVALEGMLRGDGPDVAPEVWVTSMGRVVQDGVEGGALRIAGDAFLSGGTEGWYVPEYVVSRYPELGSLDGVLKRPDLFPDPDEPERGRFYSCAQGWECRHINDNLFRAYEMEEAGFNSYEPSSDQDLAAAITEAYQRREPIFAYYWSPSDLTGNLRMHLLTSVPHDPDTWPCITSLTCADPARNTYPESVVQSVVMSGFADSNPELFDFVTKFQWTNITLVELVRWMKVEERTPLEAAVYFMRQYDSEWRRWVPDEVAERLVASMEDAATPSQAN